MSSIWRPRTPLQILALLGSYALFGPKDQITQLSAILARGTTLLVSLVGDQELALLKIENLVEAAAAAHLPVRRFPIGDYSTPSNEESFAVLVDDIVTRLRGG